jgi:phage terminase small subunit
MSSPTKQGIPDDLHNAVTVAQDAQETKLLDRDEKKEYAKLREILITLTPFQINFIEQYVRTASAGKAAKLAGSKSNTPEAVGYKLLADPRIQMALAIAMKKRIEAVGLDSVEIIQKAREVYTLAVEDKKYADSLKALEILQKEIERASKAPGGLTKVGDAVVKSAKTSKPIYEEDGVDSQTELERVVNLVRSKAPTRAEPSEA